MAFHTSSFFVGVGTVLAIMIVGFGGGVVMTNALVGKSEPREPNKIEQRHADAKAEPIPVVSVSLAPAPTPVSAEQKSVSTTVVDASPVHTNPAPQTSEKRANAAAPQEAVQPVIQPSTAMPALEVKVDKKAKRKALAEQRKMERKKLAERRKQKRKTEELNHVAESVKLMRDREREAPMARAYVAESPFGFMD